MENHRRSHDEISTLCLQLSLFLHAGIDAGSGLATLSSEEPDSELRKVLESMVQEMDNGSTLAAAFRKTEQFPGYVCGLIEVGEQTGHLEEALRALSQYYEQRARLDRRLRSALLYPAVLMLIMLAVIVVLLTKVLPIFEDVYASLGAHLTSAAGAMLALGHTLNAVMPLLCALLAAAVLCLCAFAASYGFRIKMLALWRRFCGDRGVSRKMDTARFAQALAMGIDSGLPVEEALDLASELLGDMPAARVRCEACRKRLESGDSLAKAMGETELLPRAECRLLELGMDSGCQDSVMAQIAERLSENADAALERRLGQIEPALVISSCVLVGIILLSVMLPLMHIMTAIG